MWHYYAFVCQQVVIYLVGLRIQSVSSQFPLNASPWGKNIYPGKEVSCMEISSFDEAMSYEPAEGWKRVALSDHEAFNCEWFEKPPGHSSPMQEHEHEQVSIVIHGELTMYTGEDEYVLGPYDSVLLEPHDPHSFENTGETTAMGIDIFTPPRSKDYWMD